jgi:hypothetical protein
MCELTFSDLGKLNKPYLLNQAIINALANNHDGIGYMQDGEAWKNKGSAAYIPKLGEILRRGLNDSDPVALHTRFATNKQLQEDKHSHPFTGEKLILMHNGKIEKKDYSLLPAGKVDSQVFAEELEAEIVMTPYIPMVDLLQKVMAEWCGKFAFMIYDMRDTHYYIIRGTTADLHWSTIEGRLVVNTQKLDLQKGMHVLRQQYQMIYGKDLKLGKVDILDTNTIYKFDKAKSELVDIGKLVENKKPLAQTSWVRDSGYTNSPASSIIGAVRDTEPMFKKIRRWINYHGMTMEELNLVSEAIMGCSLLELYHDDIVALNQEVLRQLDGLCTVDGLNYWKDIVKNGYANWAYTTPSFSFPWMMNNEKTIHDVSLAMDVEIARRKEEKEKKALGK